MLSGDKLSESIALRRRASKTKSEVVYWALATFEKLRKERELISRHPEKKETKEKWAEEIKRHEYSCVQILRCTQLKSDSVTMVEKVIVRHLR